MSVQWSEPINQLANNLEKLINILDKMETTNQEMQDFFDNQIQEIQLRKHPWTCVVTGKHVDRPCYLCKSFLECKKNEWI